MFRSTDNGTNWSLINDGLSSAVTLALAVSGNYLFAGTFGNGIYISTNNGTNWTPANNGLTYPNIMSFAVSGDNIFAGTISGVVFLSTDLAQTGIR